MRQEQEPVGGEGTEAAHRVGRPPRQENVAQDPEAGAAGPGWGRRPRLTRRVPRQEAAADLALCWRIL